MIVRSFEDARKMVWEVVGYTFKRTQIYAELSIQMYINKLKNMTYHECEPIRGQSLDTLFFDFHRHCTI